MSYSINWPNFIARLPLLLEILGNICITIARKPGCDVIKFEINIIFLIKPLCYMTKKSRQNLKYLENEKSFWREIKSIFHHFQRTFSCQKLCQTWECTFNNLFCCYTKNDVSNDERLLKRLSFLLLILRL